MARREDNVAINLDHLLNFPPKPAPGSTLGSLYNHLETKTPAPVTIAKLDASPVVKRETITHAIDEIVQPVFHLDLGTAPEAAPSAPPVPKTAAMDTKRSTAAAPPVAPAAAPPKVPPKSAAQEKKAKSAARELVPVAITNYRSDGNHYYVILADKTRRHWTKDKYEEYIEATKDGYILC